MIIKAIIILVSLGMLAIFLFQAEIKLDKKHPRKKI